MGAKELAVYNGEVDGEWARQTCSRGLPVWINYLIQQGLTITSVKHSDNITSLDGSMHYE